MSQTIIELAGRPLGMLPTGSMSAWHNGTLTVEEGRHEARQRKEANEAEHARRMQLAVGLATRRPTRTRAERPQSQAVSTSPLSLKLTSPRDIQDARDYFANLYFAGRPGATAFRDNAMKIRNLAGEMGAQYSFDVGKAAASLGVTIDLNPSEAERRRNQDVKAAYYPKSSRIVVYDAANHGENVALCAHELAHAVMKHEPGKSGRFEDSAQEAAAETFARSFLNL